MALWSRPASVHSSRARRLALSSALQPLVSRGICCRAVRPLAVRSPSACRQETEHAGLALHQRCSERFSAKVALVIARSRHAGLSVLRRPAAGTSDSEQRRYGCRLNLGLSEGKALPGQPIVSRSRPSRRARGACTSRYHRQMRAALFAHLAVAQPVDRADVLKRAAHALARRSSPTLGPA